MGQILGFSAQWAKTCEIFNFQGVETINFSKKGVKWWIILIQGLKWCIFQTRIKIVKFFGFWVKIVKVAKSLGFNRKILFWKGWNCRRISFELKISLEQAFGSKVSRKWFKGLKYLYIYKRTKIVNFTKEGLKGVQTKILSQLFNFKIFELK